MFSPFDRNTAITVLYRDEHLIAVHKPAGMVVHPTDLARMETVSLMGLVRRMVRQRVWPVHRLDRPTSGVVLFALNNESASQLGRQLSAHEVNKRYLALVRGVPADQIVEHPLKERPIYRDDLPVAAPRCATTRLRLLDKIEISVPVGRYPTSRYALVELNPVTGRRHQLRRHMKHISHPIIGDTTYGDGAHNRYFRTHAGGCRLFLAAVELSFVHPSSKDPLTVSSTLDNGFAEVLSVLGTSSSARG